MTRELLDRINRIMADALGCIPTGPFGGQPRYMFRQIRELLIPAKVETSPGGIVLLNSEYHWVPQVDGRSRQWCVSKWMPAPSRSEWEHRYGGTLGWPWGGYWYCFQPMKEGYEPTEDWAHWIANNIKAQEAEGIESDISNLTITDRAKLKRAHERVEAEAAERQEAYRKDVVEALRECWTDHVHGKRGGSYLAFSEPSEKETEDVNSSDAT